MKRATRLRPRLDRQRRPRLRRPRPGRRRHRRPVTVELTKGAPTRRGRHRPRRGPRPARSRRATAPPSPRTRTCAPFGFDARIVTIDKGLALAGGMGGSAASSVAGAYAAARRARDRDRGDVARRRATSLAAPRSKASPPSPAAISTTSRPASSAAWRSSRSVDPIDVVKLPVAADWWIALVTPRVRIQTQARARAAARAHASARTWIQQMANTTALAHAFADRRRRALAPRARRPLRRAAARAAHPAASTR